MTFRSLDEKNVEVELSNNLQMPLILLICISYTIITLLIHKYCARNDSIPWLHQSSVAAIIGLVIGAFLHFFYKDYSIKFNNQVFFYIVLPPIIFTAGYTLKKKKFFRYFNEIMLYGIIGTIFNFILIACAAYYYPRIFPSSGIETFTWTKALLLSSVLAASDEVSAIALIKQSDFPR